MKLHNRTLVEGTDPSIYIGHRDFKDRTTGLKRMSRQWYAEYNHQGRRCAEALKTTNKAMAIRAAHRIVERIERGDAQPVHRRTEWQEMLDGYINFLKSKRRAAKTTSKYNQILLSFIEFCKARKRMRPESVTPGDFWAFNEHLANDGYHPNSIGDRLIIIKQMFKWAVTKAKPRLMRENPISGEEVVEAESSPQPCFTPEQVEKLLAAADMAHEGPVYAVLAYLGLRIGEARELRWDDFDFNQGEAGWVTIQRGGSTGSTKNKGIRRIPLTAPLRKVLEGMPRHKDGYLFHQRPSKKYPLGDRLLSERRLLKSLKRLCKRCKFDNPDQYKLHTFRHAFASMLARNNVAYKLALEWMGHADSKILNLYITLFDDHAQIAIKFVDYSAVRKNPPAA